MPLRHTTSWRTELSDESALNGGHHAILGWGVLLVVLWPVMPTQAQTDPGDCQRRFTGPQLISTSADVARSVFAADLDGDGDVDVLSASWNDDKIAWYENTDGLGDFGPERIISTSADGAYSVFAADLDGDGDVDVLSASLFDDKIAWYENIDGLGFWSSVWPSNPSSCRYWCCSLSP